MSEKPNPHVEVAAGAQHRPNVDALYLTAKGFMALRALVSAALAARLPKMSKQQKLICTAIAAALGLDVEPHTEGE